MSRRLAGHWLLVALTALLIVAAAGGCGRSRPGTPGARPSPTPQGPRPAARAVETLTPTPAPLARATPVTVSGSAPAEPGSRYFFPIVAAPPPVVPQDLQAKIEILWPHDNAPVREAQYANLTAYLLAGPGNQPPPCAWDPVVRLWLVQNAQPARAVAIGQKRMAEIEGKRFPVWDFNDVDVSEGRDPTNKLAFFVTVDGVEARHNVWMHAVDARTVFPQPDFPEAVTDSRPAALDARIEIVWPHSGVPVEQAERANVTVYLFEAGTKTAIAAHSEFAPVVRLHRSINANVEETGSATVGIPRTVTENGISFRVWDFNDVDVSAARDPLTRIYFWASVDGVPVYTNIWIHGGDGRTIFPQVETLESCR